MSKYDNKQPGYARTTAFTSRWLGITDFPNILYSIRIRLYHYPSQDRLHFGIRNFTLNLLPYGIVVTPSPIKAWHGIGITASTVSFDSHQNTYYLIVHSLFTLELLLKATSVHL